MNEVLELFRKTGALLRGHFVLRSGLHSREFFQCALLLQDAAIAARVCGWLADKLGEHDATTVISPAVGGIIVGQEVARHLGKRHIFAEKDGSGGLVLKCLPLQPPRVLQYGRHVICSIQRFQKFCSASV